LICQVYIRIMCRGLNCVYHSSGICFTNELPLDKHQQLISVTGAWARTNGLLHWVGNALGQYYHVGVLWGAFIGTSEHIFICDMNNVNVNIYPEKYAVLLIKLSLL
jgi:hypothetical protein